MPPIGNQLSRTANPISSSMPSQNSGIAYVIIENDVSPWSDRAASPAAR